MRKVILTDGAPAPLGPYAQAVKTDHYLSGISHLDVQKTQLSPYSINTLAKIVLSSQELCCRDSSCENFDTNAASDVSRNWQDLNLGNPG